jgi:membrane-bound metal-dependent hydrolase YbcI (DUF457 family)
MTGKSHLTTSTCTGLLVAGGVTCVELSNNPPKWLLTVSTAISDYVLHTSLSLFLYVPMVIALFLLGSILPDIDHPYSMIGRIIHIPVQHRTWTHTAYIPIALWIASIPVRPLFWLGTGIFIHDLFDSVSASGLCWFYPFQKYRKYGTGAFVKKGHILKIYHTGKASEYVVVAVMVTITIFVLLLYVQIVHPFIHFG